MKHPVKFIQSLFHYVSSGIIGIIAAFLSTMLIARWFGPEIYGQINIYTIYSSILAHVITFGTGQSFLMQISKDKDKGTVSRQLSTLLVCYIFFPVVFIVIYYISNSNSINLVLFLLIVIEIGILKSIRERLLQNVFRVEKDHKSQYLMNIFSGIGKLVVVVLSIVIWENNNILMLQIFVIISALLTMTIGISRLNRLNIKFTYPRISEITPLYKKGTPFFLATLSIMGNDYASVVILNNFVSNYDLGLYSAALKLISLFILFYGLITQGIFPDIRKDFLDKNIVILKKRINFLLSLLLIISVFAVLGFLFFGSFIMSFVFGAEFEDAVILTVLLSFMLIGSAQTSVAFIVLQITEHQKIVVVLSAISAILNITLNLIFINNWGVIGAAIGTSLAMVISGTISIVWQRKIIKNLVIT